MNFSSGNNKKKSLNVKKRFKEETQDISSSDKNDLTKNKFAKTVYNFLAVGLIKISNFKIGLM